MFFLLRVLIKTTVALVMLPIVLLCAGLAIAFFAISVAVLIPLLPIVLLAACVWLVVRLASGPALQPPPA
jgi:hypothetical protein